MKLDLLLLKLMEEQEQKHHLCIEDLINLMEMDKRKEELKWGSIKREMIRRRLFYLEKNNMISYDTHHICYYCGRRKAKTVTLSKFLFKYIKFVSSLEKPLSISLLNIIGKPKEFAMLVLFMRYFNSTNTLSIKTGRKQADLVGCPYKLMLLYLNVLEKKDILKKVSMEYANAYKLNEQLIPLIKIFNTKE